MNKVLFALALIVLFLFACTTAPPPTAAAVQKQPAVRVITVVVEPTRRPPTSGPESVASESTRFAFDPGTGWNHIPDFDGNCDYMCDSWALGSGDDLLMQVYQGGIMFGIPVEGDNERAGMEMAMAALSYGVPLELLDEAADNMLNLSLGVHYSQGWGYGLAYADDVTLLMVTFFR